MEITRVNNEVVKDVVKLQQKKYRDETHKFILEGFKAIEGAYLSKIEIKTIFTTSNKKGKYLFLNCEFIETNEAVLKKISTTTTPPEAVAVAIQPENDFEKLATSKNVLLLENIRDLGNLGTIIRTSVAFDIDSIILYGETVDLYNPKVVRASVGNLWNTNIVHIKDFETLDKYCSKFVKYGTLPKSDKSEFLENINFDKNNQNLIMFGSEADGLSDKLKYNN